MKRLAIVVAMLVLGLAAWAQDGEIVPNENLVAEGIPKIPAALAESVARYSEFRSVFVIMILLEREDLRDRVLRLAGRRDLHRTTVAMDDTARRISR